jgi:hypothetical protein
MDGSLIERVSRALCLADGVDPDAEQVYARDPAWKVYKKAARAAVEALREPGKNVIEGLADGILDATCCEVPAADVLAAWQSAIDAALKPAS